MAQSIRKVGVIGAGQMGSGIAHVCALANFDVKTHDCRAGAHQAGRWQPSTAIWPARSHKKAITEEQRQAAFAADSALLNRCDDVGDCDLVIESATEKEEVKKKIFSELCPSLKPDAILATNTSSLSITRLAGGD